MSWNAAPADPAEVERLLREAGVDPTIRPSGWSAYLESVTEAILDRLSGSPLRGFFERHGDLAVLVAWILLGVMVVLVLVIGIGLILEVLRRRSRGLAGPGEGAHVAMRPMPAARDAAAWRAELERRLAIGEPGPVLEALWWWFARSVAAEVPESCTSRELVSRVGRRELAAPARELDRLLYGPRRPQADELRAMVVRLERMLA